MLFGSGETSHSGRVVHELMFSELSPPVKVAILETPAGFQPNSGLVAEEVAAFMKSRLQNFFPQVKVIAARAKAPPFSTDDPALLAPIVESNYIFLGPGSPTYAVRQMKGSLAWCYVVGRHRLGATIALASAAAIAVSTKSLPVYEIFKAGHDLHWIDGLDMFGPFGLELAIVTHWDNHEGGTKLDTSRCFVGQARWDRLRAILPSATTIVGIDEHTALVLDCEQATGTVIGRGKITVISSDSISVHPDGSVIPLSRLGPFHPPEPVVDCGLAVKHSPAKAGAEISGKVAELLSLRETARREKRWTEADSLRQQIGELGYLIEDSRHGTRVRYKGNSIR